MQNPLYVLCRPKALLGLTLTLTLFALLYTIKTARPAEEGSFDPSSRSPAQLAQAPPVKELCPCQASGYDCSCGEGALCRCLEVKQAPEVHEEEEEAPDPMAAYGACHAVAMKNKMDLWVWVNKSGDPLETQATGAVHCHVPIFQGDSTPRLVRGTYQDGELWERVPTKAAPTFAPAYLVQPSFGLMGGCSGGR